MDQEFADLLARLQDGDNPLTDEELIALQEKVKAIASEIDPGKVTEEDLAVLTDAAEASTKIQTEIDARAASAQERAARAQALIDAVSPKDEVNPDELPEEPADPETVGAPEGEPAEGDGVEPELQPAEAEVKESIAASAAVTNPRLPSMSALARRRPQTHKPVESQTQLSNSLIASADMPGLSAGGAVDPEQWAHAVARRIDAVRAGQRGVGDREKIYFGSVQAEYPLDRQLDLDERSNQQKIDAVTSEEALTASGGICGPVGVDYSVAGVSQSSRPVRDGLAQFNAVRGGIRYVRPFKLSTVAAQNPNSVGVWTAANDANPSSPTTKPHATYTCQTVQEDTVDAITSIVQFGNFQSRFFPEQLANFLETVDANHARVAESTLLAAIASGSTAVTGDINLVGATRDVLSIIDRAAAAIRYRNRMAPESPLRLLYPEWLEDEMRADLARQAPGDSGSGIERLAMTDAQIADFWRARNINATTVQDSPTSAATSQGWVIQGAGPLLPWPTKVIMHLFPEGSWMFLDGGELNLGMVRDSTLNATNDVQMFSETFEKAIFRGVESMQITADICASGQAANLVDTSSLCTSGS